MKAVVLEIRGNKAAVLSSDGTVMTVSNQNYSIGEDIDMKQEKSFRFGRNWATAAVGMAASLLIFCGGGVLAYNTPVSTITMDINPSIEYSVNIFDDVIEATALNPDGKDIIAEVDWKYGKLSSVIDETIAVLEDMDYLDPDNWEDNGLIIAVTADDSDREARLVEALRVELQYIVFGDDEDATNDDEELGDNVQVMGVGQERVLAAAELSDEFGYKVTPGKLNLIEKLSASMVEADGDPLTDEEIAEWLDKPVKEIMKEIKENKEFDDDAINDDDDDAINDDDDDAVSDDDDDDSDLAGNGNAFGKDKDGNLICDHCTAVCDCSWDQCEKENCPYCDKDCKCALVDDDDATVDEDDEDGVNDDDDEVVLDDEDDDSDDDEDKNDEDNDDKNGNSKNDSSDEDDEEETD